MFLGNSGYGRGLVALQLLSTIKKGTGSLNFSFEVSKTTNGHLKICIRCILGKCEVWGVGGGIQSHLTLNLKNYSRTSDYQSKEPLPKFIPSCFIHIPYIPPAYNLQPLLWGPWGWVIFKDIVFGPFNYVKQNGYYKIGLGVFVKWWAWAGDDCPPITFDY